MAFCYIRHKRAPRHMENRTPAYLNGRSRSQTRSSEFITSEEMLILLVAVTGQEEWAEMSRRLWRHLVSIDTLL